MKGLTWRKPVFLLLLVGVLLLGTTACAPEARELAMAWLEDWIEENDTSLARVGAAWAFDLKTGDEEVDAALDAGRAIKAIKEAEDLMAQARQAREEGSIDTAAEKMDQAIKTRPKDWTYHTERMAVAIEQGDAKKAREEHASALDTFADAGKWPRNWEEFKDQEILTLEQTRERAEGSLFFFKSYEQCYDLYNGLRWRYDEICKNDPNNKGACLAAQDYDAKIDQCQIYGPVPQY